jgi:hypothetical protein
MNERQLEDVWEALSDVFVDNEVDYPHIAERIVDVDHSLLKEIFFKDVAPHCGPDAMSNIPEIWEGYSKKKLAEGIREMKTRNEKSFISRLRYICFVAFCRFYFSDEWGKILTELNKLQQSQDMSH